MYTVAHKYETERIVINPFYEIIPNWTVSREQTKIQPSDFIFKSLRLSLNSHPLWVTLS